jgi:hypothetical protein
MNPTELFALLPDMAVFARVVDAGNFSVAARQLGSRPSTNRSFASAVTL